MAASLGSLVVSLGLDAAEFVNGLSRSEYMARLTAENLRKGLAAAATVAATALTAAAAAAGGVLIAGDRIAKQISNYKDLADAMGDTAEQAASLQFAADVSGTAIETVAGASVRLTTALSKVDDESKGAGAALKALGIPLEDFKRLNPAAQLELVAQRMSEFEDGAGKTAVAVALFGKAGAELMPFLNDLVETGGRQVRITQEQIEVADRYAKQQDILKGQLRQLGQVATLQMLPAITTLTGAFKDAAVEITGVSDPVQALATSNILVDWAEASAVAIATLIESLTAVAKAARAVAGSFEAVWADVKVGATFLKNGGLLGMAFEGARQEMSKALDERNATAEEANQRYVDLWNYNATAVSDAIKKSFAAQRAAMNAQAGTSGAAANEPPKKGIQFSGVAEKTKKEKDPLAEAKQYLEQLQKQVDKTLELNTVQTALFDMQAGRIGEVNAQLREQILTAAEQIDAAKRAEDAQKAAREEEIRITQEYIKTQDEARKIIEASRSPYETYSAQVARLTELYEQNFLTSEQLSAAVAKQYDAYAKATEGAKQLTSEMDQFAVAAARNIQSQLGDALYDAVTGKFDDILSSFVEMLAKMATQAAAAQIAKAMFGDYGSTGQVGGWAGEAVKWIGGFFASGGDYQAGETVMVGERGPELFTAATNGRITSNEALSAAAGGAGVQVNINTTIAVGSSGSQTTTSGDGSATNRELANMINESVRAVIAREMRQGGIIWRQQMGVA